MDPLKKMLQSHINENRSIYTFTIVLLVMGVIFGAVIVNSLPPQEKQDLYLYLSKFFDEMSKGKFASQQAMFAQSYSHYMKYAGFMWVLGLSVVGLPVILILLFLKGVVVGFTVGFLVNQMGWHGFMLALVSVLPQNFVLIPAFIVVSTAAVAFSLKLIRRQFVQKTSMPILPLFMRYSLLVVTVGAFLCVVSLFEAYVSPVLMKVII